MSKDEEEIQIRRSSARGAGLTEYLIVVAGISLAAAATFGAFGDTMRHQVAGMALELAGLDSTDVIAGAVASAERATSAAAVGGAFFDGSGGAGIGGSGGGFDPSLPYQPPGSGEGGGNGGGGGGSGSSGPPPVVCAAASGGSGPQVASAACDSEMALSDEGETWLKDVEKLALQPYDDQKGMAAGPITEWVPGATIGYGHLIDEEEWDRFKNGITKGEATLQFQADVGPFVDLVNDVITIDVEQHEFDAMVALAYNIGPGSSTVDGFQNSSVVKLVNDPEAVTNFSSLEAAWKAWNKSQGKVMQGLINRRVAEWDMYSKGVYRHW